MAEPQSAREFFDTLSARATGSGASEITNSYRFDVDGAGTWIVDVVDGRVRVQEGEQDADVTIATSEDNFMAIVRGDQNPMTAYMTGKLKVKGDLQAALKLQKLF